MADGVQPAEAGNYRRILGVRFFTGTAEAAVEIGLRGGLVVVPAAPALVDLEHDAPYRDALLNADLAITDSGLLVLLWSMVAREWLPRVSGLRYLKLLLAQRSMSEPGAVSWIMPTAEARAQNVAWLQAQGFPTSNEDCYLAPLYPRGELSDPALIEWIQRRRPKHIIVCLGGGVQERLGLYLRRQLDYVPGIHCIGAAIGFLSGEQVQIPMWADSVYLGWLFRCLSAPRKYVPRYWRARKLLMIMWKCRDRLPGTV